MPSVSVDQPRGGPHGRPQRPFKQRRAFGDPVAFPKVNPRFIPPPFTNRTNLVMPLNDVLDVAPILKAGKVVFHAVGDTGGVHGANAQDAVAAALEAQVQAAAPADRPAFLYHLGDVIYYNGRSIDYPTQFYEPYQYYPPFVFAIPGNHDGDTMVYPGDPPDTEPSLTGFMRNFCADQPTAVSAYRQAMTQPYVYWVLDAPLVRIIGLYSNVDGSLDGRGANEQEVWLADQLRAATADQCLLVAVHHPPYSLDTVHGGSPDVLHALDRAAQTSGRFPDAVFSGHVHCYQRFTRTVAGRQVPYVVAGAGGYANTPALLHKLQADSRGEIKPPFTTTEPGVEFAAKDTADCGFLRVTVDAQTLTGEYFAVPFTGTPPARPVDTFTVNWKPGPASARKPGKRPPRPS